MPKIGSAFDPGASAGEDEGAEPAGGVDSDVVAAEPPRRALADGKNCWAETVEAAIAAPRIIVADAEVVRRTPRLLAYLGLALPAGPAR